MNKKKRIAFGIGIVLTVLAAFTASAAADNEVYFVPDPSCTEPSNTTVVTLRMNITDGVASLGCDVYFDLDVVNITSGAPGDLPAMWLFSHKGNWVRFGGWSSSYLDLPPGDYKLADLTLVANNAGTSALHFDPVWSLLSNQYGATVPATWNDGTFNCPCGPQTYTINGTVPGVDTVNITNLNTSEDYTADVVGDDYTLTLNVPDEVEAGNKLLIVACDVPSEHESNCNVTTHTVVTAPGEDTNVDLTLNHYCLNWMTYPYKTWEQTNWSGPAVMQMMVDHYRSLEPTQSDLNATGIANNQVCNADLLQVDPKGMQWTLNNILHNTSSYGGGPFANYGIGNYDTVESALWYICYWQYLGPGAAPTYGDYSNWMAIRGIHTNVTPKWKSQGSYDIYGFWINDPKNPGGIGENTYKSVDQWTDTYHLSLTDVRGGDSYLNRYVAICEPPELDPGEVRLIHSKARFSGTITAAATDEELTVDVGGVPLNQLICNRKLIREKENKVVQAAIDGVNEQLAPYDRGFKKTFDGTVAGKPMPVTSDAGDYYLVPFGIESDGNSVLAVVIVDSDGGKFKEASWVNEPVKYLSVTPQEALKIVYKEMKGKSTIKVVKKDKATGKFKKADVIDESVDTLGDIILDETEKQNRKAYLELVYQGESPYYPVWKITIGDSVFFVDQSGTLTTTHTPIPKSIEPVLQIVE